MSRKKFSPGNNISVKFADNVGTSEGAVDVGGPKREFLRLAVRSANLDSGVFIGAEGCRMVVWAFFPVIYFHVRENN